MKITTLGIDLAKNVFQLHGADEKGKCIFKKKVMRKELSNFITNLPQCTIVMEACGGSHYWAREFKKMGHNVKLIAPKFVRPFIKSNKNDAADAEAIVEAASRPEMRFVQIKDINQQQIQTLHTGRSILLKNRIQLGNSVMGLLHEYGFTIIPGVRNFSYKIHTVLDSKQGEIPEQAKLVVLMLLEQWEKLQSQILQIEKQLLLISRQYEPCKRIQKIEGVGPLTATAVIAIIGDPKQFKNGRQFSAYLGLVPKQHSSGSKEKLLGISKRGNTYLRTLLVNGARAAIRVAHTHNTKRSRWALEKLQTRGNNRASVALANRNARVIWALLAKGEEYVLVA